MYPSVVRKPPDKLFSILLFFRLVTLISFQPRINSKYGIFVWLVVYMQLLPSLCSDEGRLLCICVLFFEANFTSISSLVFGK